MPAPRLARLSSAAFTRGALGCLWLVAWLPWSWQRLLAAAFGAFAFHIVRIRRHVVLVNLRVCFPELTESARRTLARRHYQSLALGILEVARCWWRRPAALPPCRVEGLEALEKARATGHGVLLVSGHFTTLEIAGRMLALRTPLCCLYRDPNNPVLADLLRKHRTAW
ncbi:MAG: lysophospholipid acyltransferase family protein, partial [Verrucomicrobiota bacterium]